MTPLKPTGQVALSGGEGLLPEHGFEPAASPPSPGHHREGPVRFRQTLKSKDQRRVASLVDRMAGRILYRASALRQRCLQGQSSKSVNDFTTDWVRFLLHAIDLSSRLANSASAHQPL